MSAAPPLPEPGDARLRRKLALHQHLASDGIADADCQAHATSEPAGLDRTDLAPPDLAPPGSEWPEPEWPDPSWPGFAPGRRPPSYAFTLAASPWYKERYPGEAASLWDALHPGQERHPGPEPDLEAEP